MTTRNKVGWAVIVVGLIPYGIEQTLNWRHPMSHADYHPITAIPVMVTLIMCIVGAYIMYPVQTKDATSFIVDQAGKAAAILPFSGRRASDRLAAAALATHPDPQLAKAVAEAAVPEPEVNVPEKLEERYGKPTNDPEVP